MSLTTEKLAYQVSVEYLQNDDVMAWACFVRRICGNNDEVQINTTILAIFYFYK